MRQIALDGATLFLAAACGGDDEPTGHTDEMRDDFMSQRTAGVGDSARDMSACTYDALTENMPFEQFREYDEALCDDPSAAMSEEVTAAMTECATSSLGAPATSAP